MTATAERVAWHRGHIDPPSPVVAETKLRLVYAFHVYGSPAPQGSKKGFVNPNTNRVIIVEQQDKRIKSWRSAVAEAAREQRNPDLGLLDEPLIVDMVFTFVRPAGHYRTGRNAHLLRDSAPQRPQSMPDLSKLARSTEDAISKILWRDDARIAEYGRLAKVYANEDPDALDVPGAVIRIYTLETSAGGTAGGESDG